MKKLLGISLAIIMVLGSTPLGFSEPLRVQLEAGIEIDQIQCDNPNHVLVLRTSGSIACVSERTAERTGWEILTFNTMDRITWPIPDFIVTEQVEDKLEINDSVEISITNEVKTIKQNELSKPIPNPIGYWIPISEENKEDFAKLFANAVGDSLNGTVTENRHFTEFGSISFNKNVHYAGWDLSVEPSERKKFTENFMDSMGFEYGGDDIKIQENLSNLWYYYSNEYSAVSFKFTKYMDEIVIYFNGWTNHPELVTFPLSEEIAIQKAFEYVKNIKELYIPESEGGGCEANIHESAFVLKYVDSGIPHYKIKVGNCTHSIIYIINADIGVHVIINAVTGEIISTQYPLY